MLDIDGATTCATLTSMIYIFDNSWKSQMLEMFIFSFATGSVLIRCLCGFNNKTVQ